MNSPLQRLFKWFFSSLLSVDQPAERVPAAGQILFGVRLKPGVAFLLTGVAVHKLTDRRTPLLALLAEDALRLEDRLARLQTVDEGLDILEAFLLQRLVGARIGSHVQEALKRIEDCSGQIRIAQLARECGVSPRHLGRLLRDWVGFPPKRLARIVRFQSLLQRMETSPSVGSAGVAAELGYCDQAHLVNEVAQFAGMSPGRIAPHGVADFSKTRCECVGKLAQHVTGKPQA